MNPSRLTLLAAAALTVACSSQGSAAISDQLTWAANRMNLFGGDERTVVYEHHTAQPYWIVVAPSGTTAEQVAALRLPTAVEETVQDCRKSDSFIAVVEERSSSCGWPVTFPTPASLGAVAKRGGETTQFVIHRKDRALYLVEIK